MYITGEKIDLFNEEGETTIFLSISVLFSILSLLLKSSDDVIESFSSFVILIGFDFVDL